MEVSVINIGNSKGIRLSKTILEKYGIGSKIELTMEEGYMVLTPKALPRQNWEAAFLAMNENGDDNLLIDDVFADESFEPWND